MIWIICLMVLYVVSMVVCRLTSFIIGSDGERIAKFVAFTPIANTVAMVIYIMFFFDLWKDYRRDGKDKKPETAQN